MSSQEHQLQGENYQVPPMSPYTTQDEMYRMVMHPMQGVAPMPNFPVQGAMAPMPNAPVMGETMPMPNAPVMGETMPMPNAPVMGAMYPMHGGMHHMHHVHYVCPVNPYLFQTLCTLIGHDVVIETVRDKHAGRLIDVKPDHIVLETMHAVSFIRMQEIVSIMPIKHCHHKKKHC
ncbi:uncharacterized protein DUF2642 [Aneurinibacillus soli]|uniref:Uncharacterized protein n=1 Tax=Aneurinibacillus soli TaxID=1500254 RepID=A0A0U5AXT0_9BACL|nr:DUF2642 domain-containing protein [Aneurinibacillus soli]PYE62266.1 uncharacterized protein DUF2642 [Aneurinibacillus soli]BAU28545.1 hypothetical protein CB4_02720 [Aneurinibacillus soli]